MAISFQEPVNGLAMEMCHTGDPQQRLAQGSCALLKKSEGEKLFRIKAKSLQVTRKCAEGTKYLTLVAHDLFLQLTFITLTIHQDSLAASKRNEFRPTKAKGKLLKGY